MFDSKAYLQGNFKFLFNPEYNICTIYHPKSKNSKISNKAVAIIKFNQFSLDKNPYIYLNTIEYDTQKASPYYTMKIGCYGKANEYSISYIKPLKQLTWEYHGINGSGNWQFENFYNTFISSSAITRMSKTGIINERTKYKLALTHKCGIIKKDYNQIEKLDEKNITLEFKDITYHHSCKKAFYGVSSIMITEDILYKDKYQQCRIQDLVNFEKDSAQPENFSRKIQYNNTSSQYGSKHSLTLSMENEHVYSLISESCTYKKNECTSKYKAEGTIEYDLESNEIKFLGNFTECFY